MSLLNFTLLGQLVSTVYSTAAAQNCSLLKIRLQITSFMQNFILYVFRCEKRTFSMLKVLRLLIYFHEHVDLGPN